MPTDKIQVITDYRTWMRLSYKTFGKATTMQLINTLIPHLSSWYREHLLQALVFEVKHNFVLPDDS